MDLPLQSISLAKGPTDAVILTRRDIPTCGLRDSLDAANYNDIRLIAQGLMPRSSLSRMNSCHASGGETPNGESNSVSRSSDGRERDSLDEHMLSNLPESGGHFGGMSSKSSKIRKGPVNLKSDKQLLMESKSRHRTNREVIVSAIEHEIRKDCVMKQRNAELSIFRDRILPVIDSTPNVSSKQSWKGNGYMGSLSSKNSGIEFPRDLFYKKPVQRQEYGKASGILSLEGRPVKLR